MNLPPSDPIPPDPTSGSKPPVPPESSGIPDDAPWNPLPGTGSSATEEPLAASEPAEAPLLTSDSLGASAESETVPAVPARPRRRSRHRGPVPREVEQRAAFFKDLVHQATPSLDFFIFTIISGIVAGAALVLDSPALFILAALLAPFMAPVLGLSVSAAIGNLGFFLSSLIVMLIGGAMVFLLGLAAGAISQTMPGLAFTQATFHTTFSWPDLLVLLAGAILTAYLAVGSTRQRPLVSSVALAYELYLPLAAAGFGLLQPIPGLFPDGLILAASNLSIAAVLAAFIVIFLGVHPLPSFWRWLISLLLIALLVGAALLGVGQVVLAGPVLGPVVLLPSATPTPTPTALPSSTSTPRPTFTNTPLPPTPTSTPTNTLVPTPTPTITPTPAATPVYGLVNAGEANGVIVRPEPGSMQMVTQLLNGSLLEILPEVVNKNGILWLHVRTPDGKEGWVQAVLIVTATPRPR